MARANSHETMENIIRILSEEEQQELSLSMMRRWDRRGAIHFARDRRFIDYFKDLTPEQLRNYTLERRRHRTLYVGADGIPYEAVDEDDDSQPPRPDSERNSPQIDEIPHIEIPIPEVDEIQRVDIERTDSSSSDSSSEGMEDTETGNPVRAESEDVGRHLSREAEDVPTHAAMETQPGLHNEQPDETEDAEVSDSDHTTSDDEGEDD